MLFCIQHEGSSKNEHEKHYQFVIKKLNDFKIFLENFNDTYSCLNIFLEELNSIAWSYSNGNMKKYSRSSLNGEGCEHRDPVFIDLLSLTSLSLNS
jgi:hypothetical protein